MATRFTPPTPRSRRLGRELRRLREASGLTMEQAGIQLHCSASRISRIESGEIKPKPGDVMELLVAYGHSIDSEPGLSLLMLVRALRESGWWQRMDTLSSKYATFIAYETEALDMANYEPMLVPGLLQTEAYSRAVNSVGRETDLEAIEQRVKVRLQRQAVLTRQSKPLKFHAIMSEAAISVEVGSQEVLAEQLEHIVKMAQLPNVTVQVLRFAAGAHLATGGPFVVFRFETGEPPLGYVETLAGELFVESPQEIGRLSAVYDHLRGLAMSPAESVRFMRERARGLQQMD